MSQPLNYLFKVLDLPQTSYSEIKFVKLNEIEKIYSNCYSSF